MTREEKKRLKEEALFKRWLIRLRDLLNVVKSDFAFEFNNVGWLIKSKEEMDHAEIYYGIELVIRYINYLVSKAGLSYKDMLELMDIMVDKRLCTNNKIANLICTYRFKILTHHPV